MRNLREDGRCLFRLRHGADRSPFPQKGRHAQLLLLGFYI